MPLWFNIHVSIFRKRRHASNCVTRYTIVFRKMIFLTNCQGRCDMFNGAIPAIEVCHDGWGPDSVTSKFFPTQRMQTKPLKFMPTRFSLSRLGFISWEKSYRPQLKKKANFSDFSNPHCIWQYATNVARIRKKTKFCNLFKFGKKPWIPRGGLWIA